MPNILLTNDDGYQAPALAALARALSAVGKVTVFAPDHNWSAAGHTKTMHKPLRITEGNLSDGAPLYTTTGTPSTSCGTPTSAKRIAAIMGCCVEQATHFFDT